jgi:hypothetical protein
MEDDTVEYGPERIGPDGIRERQILRGKRRRHFVMVPWTWLEKLAAARYVATYRVAHHILYWHWKEHGEPFTLSNGIMAIEGVSRWQKWRALGELEKLGLITIERRRRKTPRITVLKT